MATALRAPAQTHGFYKANCKCLAVPSRLPTETILRRIVFRDHCDERGLWHAREQSPLCGEGSRTLNICVPSFIFTDLPLFRTVRSVKAINPPASRSEAPLTSITVGPYQEKRTRSRHALVRLGGTPQSPRFAIFCFAPFAPPPPSSYVSPVT